MRFTRPSHPTVVAYLALFVALGGSAYAVSEVGSRDVTNNSLRSKDLRDQDAVTGRDVRDDKLTGKDIRERTLDVSKLTAVAHGSGVCDPSTATPDICASASIELAQPSRILLIGAGGFFSQDGPAHSTCEVVSESQPVGAVTPGEVITDNTDLIAVDGFTATGISDVLPAGPHNVRLECNQITGDARISTPTITAIAIGAERTD